MNQSRQLAALAAICDTFIPAIQKEDDPDGYWRRAASDVGVAEKIILAMQKAKAEDQSQFNQLLELLASPLLGITWMGPLKPAHRLTAAQRAILLKRWSRSPLPLLRNGFNSLRKLTGLIYFGDTFTPESTNPNWKTIGYEPLGPVPRALSVLLKVQEPNGHTLLECDVLVVGSGAAGGVVAAQLAAAGNHVIVVEKGGYTPEHAMDQREFPTLQHHFEAGGLLASTDGGMTVLAGSTLGGGTTVNWAATLRTPEYVLEEWAQHGNPHFTEKSYQAGFDFIEKRNNVHTDYRHNPQNLALLTAAQKLGLNAGAIPLNIRFPTDISEETAWKALGFSCYGDRFGIKQGSVQTFLPDAVANGASVFSNVDIQRILVKNGEAVGAEGTTRSSKTGHPQKITIKAKKVVVAAGALNTPVLLMKSGLTHPQIGQNLWLHPVAATAAFASEDTLPWHGPMMSVIVRSFEQLDGNWGIRLECPPLHPGLAAFALSWEGGESFKAQMAEIRRLSVQIAITRDKFGGRITIGKQSGQPVVHYKLSDYDRKHLLRGLAESVRLHEAAGAEHIMIVHNQPIHYYPKKDKPDKFTTEMANRQWRPNDFGLFSAHQMGTCRMGGNSNCPVKPNGETREVRNLYVADGSLFPTASGVNPMLSIQALAFHVSTMMT